MCSTGKPKQRLLVARFVHFRSTLKRVFSIGPGARPQLTQVLLCPCARENSSSRGAGLDRTRHSPECEQRISEVLSERARGKDRQLLPIPWLYASLSPPAARPGSRPRYENAPGIARRRRHKSAAHRESYAEVGSEQHPGGCRLGGANPLCEKITAPCRAPGRVYYNTFRMPMNT